METCFRLLGKDLKLMKGWMLGSLAVLVAVGLLSVWSAYQKPTGAVSVLMTVLLFIHIFYIPAYLWISLSKEWKGTYVYWLQFPQSGWTLLAVKMGSAVISLCISYAITYAFFFSIGQIEGNSTLLLAQSASLDEFDPRAYISYMKGAYLSVFSLILFMSLSLGFWILLFNISIQAVKRKLQRFSGFTIFVLFTFLFWCWFSFSGTEMYSTLTKWGAFSGDSVWAYLEMYKGEVVFELPLMAVFFFLAGWLLDRKVEV
ncbi:hypothetical protein AM501_14290 [Aneurinibacillus migulanus]|uniref:hypothetical protein n=1 Tax=Aneurinibacillus migulanus TaxID=47500 RepID=UPI0005BD1CAF|nr:hypothetical protein [Aneurinibacillus migulanus]KIV57152.1 hypothetical protein TS64_07650 [Aneurinibacillus migulanus]KPD07585.1 hypothetical protein AM501_14290 [Aneurinibacillus migulanus]MCP1357843.1 hypothetical protein [Aneurinibacillus migulanus]MED4729655.1 hypothetical protein [Aneurinibacillus migulanus]CEH28837.1 Uncharacterized protein BN1090_A2_01260 [Aneurinibacillus migulanus]